MKLTLLLFSALASAAFAQEPLIRSLGEMHKKMLLDGIPGTAQKAEAREAMIAIEHSRNRPEMKSAVMRLYGVDDAAAKIAAIFWYSGGNEEEKKLADEVTLKIKNLPFLFDWMIGAAFEESSGAFEDVSVSMGRQSMQELLAGRANDVLGTTGGPFDFHHPKGFNAWEAYTAKALRQWAVEQLNRSLATRNWSADETEVLNALRTKLASDNEQAPAPTGSSVASPNSSGAEQKKSIEHLDVVATSSFQPWTMWSAIGLAVAGALWFLVRKKSSV